MTLYARKTLCWLASISSLLFFCDFTSFAIAIAYANCQQKEEQMDKENILQGLASVFNVWLSPWRKGRKVYLDSARNKSRTEIRIKLDVESFSKKANNVNVMNSVTRSVSRTKSQMKIRWEDESLRRRSVYHCHWLVTPNHKSLSSDLPASKKTIFFMSCRRRLRSMAHYTLPLHRE